MEETTPEIYLDLQVELNIYTSFIHLKDCLLTEGRCRLSGAGLAHEYSAEAIGTACYLKN